MEEKKIEFSHIRYTIEGKSILDDVNLCIREGEHVALCGPDGAGKSTVIQLMLDFQRLDYWPKTHKISGKVTNTLFDRKTAEDVKVYLHNFKVLYDPYLKVSELLELRFGNAVPVELLKQFGLCDQGDQLVKKLPSEERKKLNIVLAIAPDSQFLFLDEITTDLDFDTRRNLVEFIKEYVQKEKITLVFATQYLEEAAYLADHICFLKEGRVVGQGSLEELYQQHGLKYRDIRSLYKEVILYE